MTEKSANILGLSSASAAILGVFAFLIAGIYQSTFWCFFLLAFIGLSVICFGRACDFKSVEYSGQIYSKLDLPKAKPKEDRVVKDTERAVEV